MCLEQDVHQKTTHKKAVLRRLFAFSLLTAHPFQTAATLVGAGLMINRSGEGQGFHLG
jgi:hypothetical protein